MTNQNINIQILLLRCRSYVLREEVSYATWPKKGQNLAETITIRLVANGVQQRV